MHVKFGKEVLYFKGWCARTQYNACCRLLGPGINIHLAENQLLRDIFHLGDKPIPTPMTCTNGKTNKLKKVTIGIRKVSEVRFVHSNSYKYIIYRHWWTQPHSKRVLFNVARTATNDLQLWHYNHFCSYPIISILGVMQIYSIFLNLWIVQHYKSLFLLLSNVYIWESIYLCHEYIHLSVWFPAIGMVEKRKKNNRQKNNSNIITVKNISQYLIDRIFTDMHSKII
jgi:hypothetical protein